VPPRRRLASCVAERNAPQPPVKALAAKYAHLPQEQEHAEKWNMHQGLIPGVRHVSVL